MKLRASFSSLPIRCHEQTAKKRERDREKERARLNFALTDIYGNDSVFVCTFSSSFSVFRSPAKSDPALVVAERTLTRDWRRSRTWSSVEMIRVGTSFPRCNLEPRMISCVDSICARGPPGRGFRFREGTVTDTAGNFSICPISVCC